MTPPPPPSSPATESFAVIDSPQCFHHRGRPGNPVRQRLADMPVNKCLQWRSSALAPRTLQSRANNAIRTLNKWRQQAQQPLLKFTIFTVNGGVDIHRVQ